MADTANGNEVWTLLINILCKLVSVKSRGNPTIGKKNLEIPHIIRARSFKEGN